ncbi:MAG TPA: hypothetical protein VGC93_10515 [Thermoanaerobaculia bacterium]
MKLADELLPFFVGRSIVRQLRVRIGLQRRKWEQGNPLDSSWNKYRQLTEDALKESLRSELYRRELMHRRGQAFLGSVAVMSAFTIGATGLFGRSAHVIPVWVLGAAILAPLPYLLGAVWFALRIVKPEELCDLYLQARMPGGEVVVDDSLKDVILNAIQLNQAYNLLFATYSSRSYRCIRNGIVCLVVALVLLVVDAILV